MPANPSLDALSALAAMPMEEEPESAEPMNPMGTDESSGEVFVAPTVFGQGKPRRGQPVVLYGTITVTGNKVGVQVEKGAIDSNRPEPRFDEDMEDDFEDDAKD